MQSLFPPTAPTIVGAFRAALARQQGWKGYGDWSEAVKDVLGDGFDELGKLSFLGPLLSKDGDPLFPCPAHILLNKEKLHPEAWLSPSAPVDCDLGKVRLPLPPARRDGSSPPVSGDGHFLTLAGLKRVLKGELPKKEEVVEAGELYEFETRVGIERNDQTRTVEDSALYNPTFVRLRQGVGLLVGLAGLPKGWEVPSIFPIGGESRMTRCTPVNKDPLADIHSSPKGHLLIALTPLIAEGEAWQGPGPGEKASGLDSNLNGQIDTLSCNRQLLVPSWDSLKGHPRNQLLAIPSGTTWWLTSPISRSEPWQIGDRCRHGYGLVVSAETSKA